MDISVNDRAAIIGGAVKNEVFQSSVSVKPRKVVFIGQADPSKSFAVETLTQVFSPEDTGAKTGFGWPLQRMHKYFALNASGVETYIINQTEHASGAKAAGSILFAGTATASGTIHLYIGGEYIPVAVVSGNTAANVATAVVAAITAVLDCPVTAVVNGSATAQVDVTAKPDGTWGNFIAIEINRDVTTEIFPAGITSATITDMTGGLNDPNITTALAALGSGDAQNEIDSTAIIHAYGLVATPVSAVSTYNGVGNGLTGNYSKTVMRPFRSLCGSVLVTSGYSTLKTFTDARTDDRTSGVIAVPGSPTHPQEIAAAALGAMESANINSANQAYINLVLNGVLPGATADRWTDDYSTRSLCVKYGISPTIVKNSRVVLQNMMTFYRPSTLPETSYFFNRMAAVSLAQNMLYSSKIWWDVPSWTNYTIVVNSSDVTDRYANVRSVDDVISNWAALVREWYAKGWLYDTTYTIEELKKSGSVAIRSGSLSGFDSTLKIVPALEGSVFNYDILVDASIAIFQV